MLKHLQVVDYWTLLLAAISKRKIFDSSRNSAITKKFGIFIALKWIKSREKLAAAELMATGDEKI